MCRDSKVYVKINGRWISLFDKEKGVKQGCIMPSWLFNVLRRWCAKENERKSINKISEIYTGGWVVEVALIDVCGWCPSSHRRWGHGGECICEAV